MVGRGHGMDAVRLVERIGPCGKLASNGRGYSLIKGRGNEKQIKKSRNEDTTGGPTILYRKGSPTFWDS